MVLGIICAYKATQLKVPAIIIVNLDLLHYYL